MGTSIYHGVKNTCHNVHTCLHQRTKHLCSFPPTLQHVRMHTRKNAWNDCVAATARGADDADAGGSARLLCSTQSTLRPCAV